MCFRDREREREKKKREFRRTLVKPLEEWSTSVPLQQVEPEESSSLF
jgi:hypothetical protein